MNVGIVTTWFERGASYVSRQYLEALRRKYNVFVYARGGESYAKGDPNWDFENVYWSKKLDSPFVSTVIDKNEFTSWIKNNRVDVVLFNEQHWWPPLLWCREMGVKTVAYVDYYTETTLPLFAIYDVLICNTRKHYDAFKWHQGAYYLPWGTDIKLYQPKERDEYNEDLIFFHSCGMGPHRKGTDRLLRSIPKIIGDGFKIIIHTQKDLKSSFPDLEGLIDSMISKGKLVIIEKTVSAPGLFYLGDVYVYPSRLEGIGLTVIEAMASGLALIVPDCGPMNEFVDSSFGAVVPIERLYSRADGYFWPQNEVDESQLAKEISQFVQKRESIAIMKQEARNHAVRFHDWDKNSNLITDLFDSLMLRDSKISYTKVLAEIQRFENTGTRKFNRIYLYCPKLFNMLKRLAR